MTSSGRKTALRLRHGAAGVSSRVRFRTATTAFLDTLQRNRSLFTGAIHCTDTATFSDTAPHNQSLFSASQEILQRLPQSLRPQHRYLRSSLLLLYLHFFTVLHFYSSSCTSMRAVAWHAGAGDLWGLYALPRTLCKRYP